MKAKVHHPKGEEVLVSGSLNGRVVGNVGGDIEGGEEMGEVRKFHLYRKVVITIIIICHHNHHLHCY